MKVEVIRNNENKHVKLIGKLYESSNGIIIICTGISDGFAGTVIQAGESDHTIGSNISMFDRDAFTPFSGTIKITQ